MAENYFLTPNAIANRIKERGLEWLLWYCQVCEERCQDENGFKCHCMSESHQRQMEVIAQNPNRIVSASREQPSGLPNSSRNARRFQEEE